MVLCQGRPGSQVREKKGIEIGNWKVPSECFELTLANYFQHETGRFS